MEQQVLHLLEATTTPDTTVIRNAEQGLLALYPQLEFPFALLTIASHSNVIPGSRKAALTALKNYVSATWSPQLDDTFTGSVYLNDETKGRVREQIFNICTDDGSKLALDSNIQALAAAVASRIASVDFPDAWPSLFPSLLDLLNSSTKDGPVHGSLRVLAELIDSGFTEEQFFAIAHNLVHALLHVAVSSNHSLIVRAMTLNVFRSCFEMLEMVIADHGPEVKAFLDESLKAWMPLFIDILQQPLPEVHVNGLGKDDTQLRGLIAFKVQVVKTLDKLRHVYVHAISPHAVNLFQIVWEELSRIAAPYTDLFIEGNYDGKLIDGDNLPCSLDALVLEELDFLQMIIKAPTVRSELNQQMKQVEESKHTVGWLQEFIRLLASYARIPKEEEALWEYDANLYLCEATSITANYTPRAACAELAVRSLGEWLKQIPVQAVLYFIQSSQDVSQTSWKEREALLFLLNQLLKDLDDISAKLATTVATTLLEQVSGYLGNEQAFMRAAAHLVLASFFNVADEGFQSAGAASFTATIQAAIQDDSDVVKVSCISVVPQYVGTLPASVTVPMQQSIINGVSEFINAHDLRDELEDADDVKASLIQTLRDAIMLDTSKIVDTPAMDIFFTLASDGASNFQLSSQLLEAFEGIVSSVTSHSHELYVRLCAKTIPSLTGAFDIANMTQESALTNLAAELVSALTEFGSEPLPDGFVVAVMPKLQRVLMEATDAELVRPATLAVQHMLTKGTTQFIQWTDSNGKSALEVTLTIINRLLNSFDVDENAGQEVGGLASSVVIKFGADKLGPYLMELLRAVAIRMATAERIQFIQSLCMVFIGLSIAAPKEVLDFLSEVNINGQNGLNVVLTKWLENSVHFAGFDEVRQNVVALSKLYSLQDPRVKQINVKGDLIVENTGRIKTRSQAKLNPDRYTSIPADLRIVKIMVDELSNAAKSQFLNLSAAEDVEDGANGADGDDDDDDDADEWEDVANTGTLDLVSQVVKNDLMAWGNVDETSPTGSRARDEETADYLMQWFRQEAPNPAFQQTFSILSEDEQAKLRRLVE